jgi:hypothetical protein
MYAEAERRRGLELNYEVEFGWLLHWQISRVGTIENRRDITGALVGGGTSKGKRVPKSFFCCENGT